MDIILETSSWIFIIINTIYIYRKFFIKNSINSNSNTNLKLNIIGTLFLGIAWGRIIGMIIAAHENYIPSLPYGTYIIGMLAVLSLSTIITQYENIKLFVYTVIIRIMAGCAILSFGIFNSMTRKFAWLNIVFAIMIIIFMVRTIINMKDLNDSMKIVVKENETNKKKSERENIQKDAGGKVVLNSLFIIMFTTLLLSSAFLP